MMKAAMPEIRTILYPHAYDPEDPDQFSGTTYHLGRALRRRGIEVIPAILKPPILPKVRAKAYSVLGTSRFPSQHTKLQSNAFGRQVASLIERHEPDAVLSTSSIPVSGGDYKVPRFFYTDATIALILDYPEMAGLSEPALREARFIEGEAIRRSTISFYSSEWARQSAIHDFAGDPNRIRVVPFGANLSSPPERETILAAIDARSRDRLDLLFIGKDWERKGGEKAVTVTQLVRESGIDANLCILGTTPDGFDGFPDWVKSHGFVSKKTEEGQARIAQIFSEAHFFLLPTTADCTPIVFAEASAYGLPSATHDVGGVAAMIHDGENGLLFSPDCPAEAMAEAIASAFRDAAGYRQLCQSSRQRYDQVLNWDAVAANVLSQMNEALAQR